MIGETVICPKCGQPFPKKRYDLGYKCCCNCSTEKKLVGITEGQLDGEDADAILTIVRPEVAAAYYNAISQSPAMPEPEEEQVDPLELRTILDLSNDRAEFEASIENGEPID